MNKLAILVLNYNGQKFLKECFDSLFNQNSKDFDIYLVDNNSSDESRAYTEKNYPTIKIVNTGGNFGFTGAYNHICKYFDANNINYLYYLFLNNDTECDSSMVEKILKIFEISEKIGIVIPAIVNKNMIIDQVGGKLLFLTGTTLGHKNGEKYKKSNDLYRCFWASGCAMIIKSDLFKKLGYFKDYFMYYEDVDISWKANNEGYFVLSTDSTFVKHFQGGTKKSSHLELYMSEKNRLLCYWQNLSNFVFFAYFPFFILTRLMLILYKVKSFNDVKAKVRGLIAGIFYFHEFKKKNYSFFSYFRVIKNMNKILIYNY